MPSSLDDADWFNEGCDDVFIGAGASPASIASAEQPFGLLDFNPSAFGLAPEQMGADAADLLPWLDSLTASTVTALAATSDPQPTALTDVSSTEVKCEAEPAMMAPLPKYLPSPQHSFAADARTPSPPLHDVNFFGGALMTPEPLISKQSPTAKKAAVAAAAAAAKRKTPSTDDEPEDVLIKRMKVNLIAAILSAADISPNTEAARRSRARKTARLETLEMEVTRLEQDKANLLVRLAVLESERNSSALREADLAKRVAQLEDQLAESHRAMVMGLGIQTRI
ncbi:hypothetical protein HK405_007756 [Cladochytrium tenue]|nr:hypothetical protein HK405_007756 [Cladochytrium tenue]